jgi:hypothetical protein
VADLGRKAAHDGDQYGSSAARDHKSLAYRMLTLRRRCIVSIAPRSAMRGADSTIERPKCPLAHGHKRGSEFTNFCCFPALPHTGGLRAGVERVRCNGS